jgi:hypothetical protein
MKTIKDRIEEEKINNIKIESEKIIDIQEENIPTNKDFEKIIKLFNDSSEK